MPCRAQALGTMQAVVVSNPIPWIPAVVYQLGGVRST